MDKTRLKVVYREGEVANSIGEKTEERFGGWILPIKKQDVVVIKIDFSRFSGRPKIARMFMAAFAGLSSKLRQKTLNSYFYGLVTFMDFLADMESVGQLFYEPRQIDSQVVRDFIFWLTQHTEWSVSTQYHFYMDIKSLLTWMKRHRKSDLAAEINFPRNPFPRKNAQTVHRPAYSLHVIDQLKKAVLADIEEIKRKIETPYVKTGKGVDPRSDYGQWKDFDNMVWYFENVFDCKHKSYIWLSENGHSSFNSLARRYHGGPDSVWDKMGVWNGTTQQILIPFVLLFAYLSGANPTPILTMHRGCIRQHPSLDRKFLNLEKERSGNASYRIKHSSMCIEIVERVLEITNDLALEADDAVKDFLWLYMGRDGKVKHLGMGEGPFNAALYAYAEKHAIVDESGAIVKLNLARLRPTFATRLFLKTKGDLVKLKEILGHEYISTTMPYVSSAGIEDMRENAAKDLANQEKKLRAQIAVGDVASELGISREENARLLSGEYDTYLGKCRNLMHSPLPGEREGKTCTRFNTCLKCPNCMITADDLHRLLSYYNHINRLGKFMPSALFGKTYGWVIQAIDEVSTKFKEETVSKARAKALSDPFPAWDRKLVLAESLEKTQHDNDSKQNVCVTGSAQEGE